MTDLLTRNNDSFAIRRLIAAGALLLIVGCSATSTSRSQNQGANCPKSPVAGNGKSGRDNASLNLSFGGSSQLTDDNDSGIGTGYLDISTKNLAGEKESRRCTVHLRPIDSSNSVVRLWTAGHCFFDPQTVEFQNSTYTAQIYLNGGYFSAAVDLEGIPELGKFSKAVVAFLGLANIPEINTIVGETFQALPSATGQNCIDDGNIFKGNLSNAKSVACFARSEVRGFKAKLSLSEKTSPHMKRVMDTLRARESAALAKLDASSKKQLEYYQAAHFAEVRRLADLRSLAFALNKRICDVYESNNKSEIDPELYDASLKKYDSVAMCGTQLGQTYRDLIVNQLSQSGMLPESDLSMMKQYWEVPSGGQTLQTLRARSMSCNVTNIATVTQSADQLTPCDMGILAVQGWAKWVDNGTQPVSVSDGLYSDSQFGFNPESYFTLITNAAETSAQLASGARGKARVIPLNVSSVLNFGTKVSSQHGNTMLINFDSAAQRIYLSKGDSGSMLSVFGYFPMGLLSTVDGEKTAGGASVTPLPEVDSEDIAVSNGGC
jgi:hypothetical protein